MNTGNIDRSQAENGVALTDSPADDAQAMVDIGEGERLRRLLEAKRYEQKELADAIGVTKAAVGLWMKRTRFSDRVWERVRTGLVALRLNPQDIRPEEGSPRPQEDLTKLVETWSRVQLSVIKRILESDDTSRDILLAYINGSLREIP